MDECSSGPKSGECSLLLKVGRRTRSCWLGDLRGVRTLDGGFGRRQCVNHKPLTYNVPFPATMSRVSNDATTLGSINMCDAYVSQAHVIVDAEV